MDEDTNTAKTSKPAFKKRGNFKGHIRQKDPEVKIKKENGAAAAAESGDDDDVDKQVLSDIRKVHELKKRKAGTDVAGGLNKASKLSKDGARGAGGTTTTSTNSSRQTAVAAATEVGISASIKSQFSSNNRMGDDPIGSIAHRDIMEKYVEEQLGLAKGNEDKANGHNSSDIGQQQQQQQQQQQKQQQLQQQRTAEEDAKEQAGFFTGIAEVDLGDVARLRNIRETEKSLKEMAGRRKATSRGSGSGHAGITEEGYEGRFAKPKSRADYLKEEQRLADLSGAVPTVALPPTQTSSSSSFERSGGNKNNNSDRQQQHSNTHHTTRGGSSSSSRKGGPVASDAKMMKSFLTKQKY